MRITIAQLNPLVGDIDGNLEKLKQTVAEKGAGSDLVVFSELFLTGYPPRDLLERPGFLEKARQAIDDIAGFSRDCDRAGILVGVPREDPLGRDRGLYNSAVLIDKGKILHFRDKTLLPAYDVFDETRYFEPASSLDVVDFRGEKLGISICEDMWNDPALISERNYDIDPMEELEKKGATVLVNISASPFYSGKEDIRYNLVRSHARKYGIPFVFVNQVGGNDELVFDGRSICVDPQGEVIAILPSFREAVETVDLKKRSGRIIYVPGEKTEGIYEALLLGIRDYVNKCGFKKAIVGLSGGIDSSVVCALATEALGNRKVLGITMPSEYSAGESLELASDLADRLGVDLRNVPIGEIYSSYKKALEKELGISHGNNVEVYLQNIQARIRGDILMAYSNRMGHMLLTTGNKSEMAVGYCTLYGDMAGGLAVISDVPKTMVYDLARYINRDREIIPGRVLERPPSAELSPGQLDQEALPPYDVLDRILSLYIEETASPEDIKKKGFDRNTVDWVVNAVRSNEYKRRQAPPGIKVTSKAFGMGRRMPIAAKYCI